MLGQAWYRVVGQLGQKVPAKEQRMDEKSRFLRDADGRWLFQDGKILVDGQPVDEW